MRELSYLKVLSRHLSHGNMEVLIAEYYLGKMEWGKARIELIKGFDKGQLADPERAKYLLKHLELQLGSGAIQVATP